MRLKSFLIKECYVFHTHCVCQGLDLSEPKNQTIPEIVLEENICLFSISFLSCSLHILETSFKNQSKLSWRNSFVFQQMFRFSEFCLFV